MKTYKLKVTNNALISADGDGIDSVVESMIRENGLLEGQEVEIAILPEGFLRELKLTLSYLEMLLSRLKEEESLFDRVVEINIGKLEEMTGLKLTKD